MIRPRSLRRPRKIRALLLGGVESSCGEDWAEFSGFLQSPQGLPGIGLVEALKTVAGERLPVQAAKIVESQETASFDR